MRKEYINGEFARYEYTYPEDDWEPICSLTGCIPYKDVFLYRIKATYAKSKNPSTYYLLGKSLNHVRKRFRNMYSWLKIVSIDRVDSTESEYILSDYRTIPF